MQYLLTQQEFDALQSDRWMRDAVDKGKLQALCTLAADHIPIVVEWRQDKTPRPWGCILSEHGQSHGYCDDCPARNVCPYEGKEWSK